MNIQSQNKQQGVALVVSLIILVSLTMLGLTSIQRTTTDLSMAGNQREAGLMFQAAEVGLLSAENSIGVSTSNNDFNGAANAALGKISVPNNDPTYFHPDYYAAATWTASQDAPTSLYAFGNQQPQFMIEYLGNRLQNPLAAPNIGGYGTLQTGDIASIYRSTSRGLGLTGNSFRYLQSYLGKPAP